MTRRRFLRLAANTALIPAMIPAMPHVARAEPYPNRPVRIVVGFAPGGPNDINARLVGQWLSDRLGQQFIIDNRPGASGNIAMEQVVKSPTDGYTLTMIALSSSVNATLFPNLPFNFVRDITPIGAISRSIFVMEVHPSVPVQTGPELIAYAKAHPNKLNFCSPGSGTGPHMASELFLMMAGLKMTHVPYRGSGPMLNDLLGGQVQFAFDGTSSSVPHIKAGKLRALGVSTETRVDLLPGVPAITEFLPGYEAIGAQGLGVPRGTPPEIIDLLNRELNAGLADPTIKARLAALGNEPFPTTPAQYAAFLAKDTEKWGKVVRAAGLKPE